LARHGERRLVVLPVGRPEEERRMRVARAQQVNRAFDLAALRGGIEAGEMGVALAVRLDLEEGHGEEPPHVFGVRRHPATGQEERSGDLLRDELVHERGVESTSAANRTEVESESNLVAATPHRANHSGRLGSSRRRQACVRGKKRGRRDQEQHPAILPHAASDRNSSGIARGSRRSSSDTIALSIGAFADQSDEEVASRYFWAFAPFASFASMLVALIRYWIVTLLPTFGSPVTLVSLSRASSQRSLPFCTAIMSSFTSST